MTREKSGVTASGKMRVARASRKIPNPANESTHSLYPKSMKAPRVRPTLVALCHSSSQQEIRSPAPRNASTSMAAIRDSFPLGNHRASLARYLRQIVFPMESVAGTIIRERLAPPYVGDPLRPALVLWACDAVGGDVSDALPVAAAFDLFDRFLMLHSELSSDSAAVVARWGLGQSLNAGDAFLALAFRSLAGEVRNPQRRLSAAQLVAQAVLEAIDESVELRRNATLTGAALHVGTVVAGAPKRTARAFEQAGRLLISEPIDAGRALHDHTSREQIAVFEEVAQYVAQRAA